MFGQSGGSDAFGRRAVKNIGIRTDIGQTFAETGATSGRDGAVTAAGARSGRPDSRDELVPSPRQQVGDILIPYR